MGRGKKYAGRPENGAVRDLPTLWLAGPSTLAPVWHVIKRPLHGATRHGIPGFRFPGNAWRCKQGLLKRFPAYRFLALFFAPFSVFFPQHRHKIEF